MTYDLSELQGNSTQIIDLVTVTNDATGGVMLGGIIIALFIIQAAVLSRKAGLSGAATFSSWLTFIYSLFLTMAGLLNPSIMIAFLLGSAFGAFYLWYQSRATAS